MLKILVYLFCFICVIHGKNETESAKIGKIVGPGEHPYAVYIPKAYCAGTLVKLDTVMSAGHCFFGLKFQGWEVLAGIVNFNDNSTSSKQIRKILNVVVHPRFKMKRYLVQSNRTFYIKTTNKFYNNIAKIVLDRPFQLTKEVRTAEIVSKNIDEFRKDWEYIVNNDITCYSMGWRKCRNVKCEKGESGVLTSIPLIHREISRCEHEVHFGEVSMCRRGEVTFITSGKMEDLKKNRVYSGDSGGPLICGGLSYGVNTVGIAPDFLRNETVFVLFWPYIDFFGDWTLRSHSSALFQHELLAILITFYSSKCAMH